MAPPLPVARDTPGAARGAPLSTPRAERSKGRSGSTHQVTWDRTHSFPPRKYRVTRTTQVGVDFFLHESRRYVCRFCASHLGRVKKELHYRLQTKKKKQKPPNNTTKTQKPPEEGSNLLRNSCGHGSRMRRGETGAMNSAKLSVHLVPQQTD